MAFEDRLTIATPEGVDLEVTLAGLGSRLIALLVDSLVQTALLLALLLGLAALVSGASNSESGRGTAFVAIAIFVVIVFLVQFGYHVLFETLGSGRTPGKRMAGLRVVRVGGAPVGLTASAVRNLIRLLDSIAGIGLIAILASPRNQRLGDIVAGTLVVRERRDHRPLAVALAGGLRPEAEAWDVSMVTADDLATVRRFLDRRPTLTPEARGRLAWDLAERLRAKVAGADADLHPETFLETLVAAKGARA